MIVSVLVALILSFAAWAALRLSVRPLPEQGGRYALTVYVVWYNGTLISGAPVTVSNSTWEETKATGSGGDVAYSLSGGDYRVATDYAGQYLSYACKGLSEDRAAALWLAAGGNWTSGDMVVNSPARGVEHIQIARSIPPGDGVPGGPVLINLLRVNLSDPSVRVFPALAGGVTGKKEPLSQIFAENEHAVAAINSGFVTAFSFIIKIDGRLYSEPELNRSFLAITYDGVADIDSVLSSSDPKLERYKHVVGGNPGLVRNGAVHVTGGEEYAEDIVVGGEFGRHPRTAVGVTADNRLLMMTVDGRQENWSIGMGLSEVAQFLIEFGAVEAVNFDGGGSTTCVVGGALVNRPSDGTERPVPIALIVASYEEGGQPGGGQLG